jgi:hypothetical protein
MSPRSVTGRKVPYMSSDKPINAPSLDTWAVLLALLLALLVRTGILKTVTW